ncbi:MAG: hypothetical protein DME40_14185 [Verrucomicrobia bacterium]|nr:MAG: hypothetical protein DME40_14185 [Verrucomicrobiota bacterium]
MNQTDVRRHDVTPLENARLDAAETRRSKTTASIIEGQIDGNAVHFFVFAPTNNFAETRSVRRKLTTALLLERSARVQMVVNFSDLMKGALKR